jgi:hypothetical protein
VRSLHREKVDIKTIDGIKNRSSFTQIKDERFKPLGVLNLPYLEDDGFYQKELSSFNLLRTELLHATSSLSPTYYHPTSLNH